MNRAIIVSSLTLLFGCAAPAGPPAGADRIAPGYVSGGGDWSSGGGITAVARAFGRDGRTVVCGAWMTDRQSVISFNSNDSVMAVASVSAGDTRLVSNLLFMSRLEYSDDITGQSANCVYSTEPWTERLAASQVNLRFPRLSADSSGVVRPSLGIGLFAPGDVATFRQGPRPDPVRSDE